MKYKEIEIEGLVETLLEDYQENLRFEKES